MKKVKRKNLYGEKISRERTNEYKLGKYVKKNWGDRHSLGGGIQTFFRGGTDIYERMNRHS